MKTIGMDVRMWSHPGIGRYTRELVKELVPLAPDIPFCLLGIPSDRKAISHLAPHSEFRAVSSPIYSILEQWEIPREARTFDLLHVPHFNIPFFYKKKLIVTIHDLIYLYPHSHTLPLLGRSYVRALFKRIVKKADGVLTVSEFTKRELLRLFPKLPDRRIFVTPEAAAVHFRKIEDLQILSSVRKKFKLEKPFILFVGSFKPHKNLPNLMQAVSLLREKRRLDHELVMVGRPDKKNEGILRLATRHSFARILGELNDEELVALYNLADVFVLPSFWEGFGLPILEAMACGAPVVASNRSSLPEVVGKAGFLFDPDRVDALEEVLYNVLVDKELRKKMSLDGLERARCFSWKKTAEETLRVYRQILCG